jgi:hypothetical protein
LVLGGTKNPEPHIQYLKKIFDSERLRPKEGFHLVGVLFCICELKLNFEAGFAGVTK